MCLMVRPAYRLYLCLSCSMTRQVTHWFTFPARSPRCELKNYKNTHRVQLIHRSSCLTLTLSLSLSLLPDMQGISALFVTDISVPEIVDFRDNVTLSCSYDMSGHTLNSVKWYKDRLEFFR